MTKLSWLRPVVQPPALVGDLSFALLVSAVVEVATPWALGHGPGAASLDGFSRLLLALPGLALALHRRRPGLTFAGTVVLASAALAVTRSWGPVMIAPLFALFNLVAYSPVREWLLGAVAGTGVLAVVHGLSSGWSLLTLYVAIGWLAAAGIFGLVVEVRRRFQAEVVSGELWAERSRDEAARRRMAEERLNLARDVHDVVGHSLAVISLQAGVAEHLLESRPGEARKAVDAVRTVSKQALDDLRAELAALRAGIGGEADRAPSPGLEALPDLVRAMRDAGLQVRLEMPEAPAGGIPGPVAAAGYRIVQESLTNVARHAGPGAAAVVSLRLDMESVQLDVSDDGKGARPDTAAGGGLTGMRERAAALGGRLVAENREGGGFRVRAWLPRGTG